MRSTATWAAAACLAWGMTAVGQSQPPATDSVAAAIPGVVAAGTRVQVIKEGFQGTEGPIALPDGSLIFTETTANRITRIDQDGRTSTFLENTNGANGLAFDTQGRLIAVQTTPGNTKVGVIYPKASEAVLADGFEGRPFGRPNDLVIDRKGGVYFTEPGPNAPQPGTPGAIASPPATPPLPPSVYYIPPGGTVVRVADGIERPNGIQLSPDERTLYVNNTVGEHLIAFDINPDGTVGRRRDFAKYEGVVSGAQGLRSGADGLAIDQEGRVYAATTAGVQVFDPTGAHLGTIPVSRSPQNIAFAGAGKNILYIVGRGAAWKVQLLTPGYRGRVK